MRTRSRVEQANWIKQEAEKREPKICNLARFPSGIQAPSLILLPVGWAQFEKLNQTLNLRGLTSAAVAEMLRHGTSGTNMVVAAIDVSPYSLAPPIIPTVEGDMRSFPEWKGEHLEPHHGSHLGWMEAVCIDTQAAHVMNALYKVLHFLLSDTNYKPGIRFFLLLVDDNTGEQHATAWARLLSLLLKVRGWRATTMRSEGVGTLKRLCQCRHCMEPVSQEFITARDQQLAVSCDLCKEAVAAYVDFAPASAF